MIKKMRKLLRIIFGRTALLAVFLLIQIGILFSCFRWLSRYMFYIYGGFILLGAVVVIYILNKKENPSFKLAWMIPVLVIPVFGALFYLFVELQIGVKVINRRLGEAIKDTKPYMEQDEAIYKEIEQQSKREATLLSYFNHTCGYPAYKNTEVKYYPYGEDAFPDMVSQLKSAKRFIFMEYFIVERGVMWNTILEILKEKVKEGVEVRFMYDGMCSIALLPYNYPKQLQKYGIKCKQFSPIRPALSSYQNNRDHRKITVIDGLTAFTGGINLADEYINQKERFGRWKDTSIMVSGDAVDSFTMMFLQMWSISEREKENYAAYLRPAGLPASALGGSGYVIPFGDSPTDHEPVGANVYRDILNQAKSYVHIMTPYLILDYDMTTALTYAAKRGVETIIIMPHIPDKVYAYLLARSYYEELIETGVKIYEYTPGFVHAKVFTSDDEKAVVGTINLDFRSLYLHFECAAYLYRNSAVQEIEADFQETLKFCNLITLEECRKYPLVKKAAGSMLRLFAPLM